MSAILMGRAFYTDLPSHLKFTLVALADHANDDGAGIHVGQRHLAGKIGAKERAVRDHLHDLRDQGFIRVIGRTTARGVTCYEIDVARLPSTQEIEAIKAAWRRPADSAGQVGQRQRADRQPSAALDRQPSAAEPSVEPPGEPSSLASLVRAPARRRRDPIFEALYEIWLGRPYPHDTDATTVGLTDPARSKLALAAGQLLKAGATPAEVRRLPEAWVAVFPGRNPPTWTPSAATSHWPALKAWLDSGYVARGSGPSEVADLRDELAEVEASARSAGA